MTKTDGTFLFNSFQMKNSTVSLGIDIASADFQVYLRQNDSQGINRSFKNTSAGIQQLIGFLKKNTFEGKIVMESTGRYHFLCAVMLSEAGYFVSVINPLITKKYQSANIRKCKTDKIDAQLLAQVAFLESKLPRFQRDRSDLVLRQKISLLHSLEKHIQSLTAAYSNFEQTTKKLGQETTECEKNLFASIKEVQKNKKKLEQEIIDYMQNKEAQKMKILQSIPGVSEYLASLMLFFFSGEIGLKAKQWVAYLGMEISVLESGKWRGRGRLSKRGNRYLRKRTYCGGWGAMMQDEHFRALYDGLREKGRGHVEALTILARKIIRIAFALIKNNEFFDSKKCFL